MNSEDFREEDWREQEIVNSWYCNAAPWGRAIRTASIASRQLVTNQAIIDAVASVSASRILDIGCGEGWLARALRDRGMSVTGVDIVPELIAQAVAASDTTAHNTTVHDTAMHNTTVHDTAMHETASRGTASGGLTFHVRDYASIANLQWRSDPFDAAVCNFSLLGAKSVESLIAALPWYLVDQGYLIIQTLHPVAACGEQPYQDGWREGNWRGFSGDFNNPAPWYFRTLESWTALLQGCGFDILECREPTAAGASTAASVIWIGKTRRSAQT